MESLNKNWLAIILIVIVFTSLGFILGWILKPPFPGEPMPCHPKMPGSCQEFNMPCCQGENDSLENVDVKVIVNKEGETVDSNTKVIVKKVVR
jgi:hypothetical protein